MVDIIGRAKVIVESEIDKSSLDSTGGKIGGSLKKAALIGVTAFSGLTVAGFKAFKSFEEGEKVAAKLANVLGNMGESANVAAVEQLATSISRTTGVSDELIQSGQTILATFSNVAESAGEVGGSFERASKASVDLASAGFGTVESASVMLGKALQDPVKGVSALSRAGVTFSQDQKKLIESLVETGDVADAQKIILAEVEKQVGGTAEASATASDKIKNAMSEAGEALGNVIDTLAGGKDEGAKGEKTLDQRIDGVTDALNRFAESEGLQKFRDNIDEMNRSDFSQSMVEQNEKAAESILETIVLLSGIPDKLGEIRDDIADGGLFDGVSDQLEQWETDMAEGFEAVKSQVSADFDSIVEDVREAPGRIADQAGEWVDAGGKLIDGFIEGLKSKFTDFKSILNEALGLPRTISIGDGKGGIPDASFTIKAFAAGGPASGLSLVGERGPELVNLPAGSYVHSNSNSQEMLAAASGGGDTFNITHIGNSDGLVQKLNWNSRYRRVGVQQGVNA